MRTRAPQPPESPERVSAQNRSYASAHRRSCAAFRLAAPFAASASFFAAPFVFGVALAAQTPATPAPAPTPPAVHAHRKPTAAKPAAPSAQAAAPAAPQIPNWPANHKPAEASVVWDSHGLLIQASNSSLDQILRDVSLKTGAKVEGMGADERVFGAFGPGPAREVLAKLLDGSGYNILMVGDLGQGTPRRIVLSGRPVPAQPSGNANPGASNENDAGNDQEAEPQPEQNPPLPQTPLSQPGQNGAPAVPMRTPQQIMQDRQLQMQQMQQIQAPPTSYPPTPPTPPN